jgi:peptide/nickel transport system substrate-binding protein
MYCMSRKVTRSIIAVAAVAAIGVVSAGAAGPSSRLREGGAFRYALGVSFVESIDPFLNNWAAMEAVFDATCGSLVHRRDKPLPAGRRLVPELAHHLPSVSNRGKTYTFAVRRGQRFSTRAPVTPRDVAATVMRALRLKRSYRAGDFMNVIGARSFVKGRASGLRGLTVQGNRITFRLIKPQPSFTSLAGTLCILPAELSLDAEGVHAPVPSAGPYTLTSYVPGRRIVLTRNRSYRGSRPQHFDRIDITLVNTDAGVIEAIERGAYDSAAISVNEMNAKAPRLQARYGVNRQRFFVRPGEELCMLHLNTSRPLFRNNAKLRRAVNFAINRSALIHEIGPHSGAPADQYLLPFQSAFRDARIYPARPDLKTALALAKGNRRSGKAVLYVDDFPIGRALGAIVRANLARLGLDVEVRAVPPTLKYELLVRRGEPWDIAPACFDFSANDLNLHTLFDGRTLHQPEHSNYSHFSSPEINRRLDQASQLTGRAFDWAYGSIDVAVARDYAPAVALSYSNVRVFVSARTGCVVLNPALDLAAVCLK